MKVLGKLDDVQRGHHKGSILSRRLSRRSSQCSLPLPVRGASGEGGRAPLTAHRSSYYFVLLFPPSIFLFPSLLLSLGDGPDGCCHIYCLFAAPISPGTQATTCEAQR
ncbi:uncharacterized [Tachysurus ichikawai]